MKETLRQVRLIAPRRDKKSVIMLLQGLIKFHIRYNCICLCITSHIYILHPLVHISLIIKLKFIVAAHVEKPRHFGSTMTREGRGKKEVGIQASPDSSIFQAAISTWGTSSRQVRHCIVSHSAKSTVHGLQSRESLWL